jgi:hypothetical protein
MDQTISDQPGHCLLLMGSEVLIIAEVPHHQRYSHIIYAQIGQKWFWACEVTSHLVPYWLAAFIHLSCSCCVSPDFWFSNYSWETSLLNSAVDYGLGLWMMWLTDNPSRIIYSREAYITMTRLIANGLVHNLDYPPTEHTPRIEHEVQLLPGICIATSYGLVHLNPRYWLLRKLRMCEIIIYLADVCSAITFIDPGICGITSYFCEQKHPWPDFGSIAFNDNWAFVGIIDVVRCKDMWRGLFNSR